MNTTFGCVSCNSVRTYCSCGALTHCGCGKVVDHECPTFIVASAIVIPILQGPAYRVLPDGFITETAPLLN